MCRSVLYTHPTQPLCAAVVFISMLVGNLGCIHTDVHSRGSLFTAMIHTDRRVFKINKTTPRHAFSLALHCGTSGEAILHVYAAVTFTGTRGLWKSFTATGRSQVLSTTLMHNRAK